jgi:hypothetical protein
MAMLKTTAGHTSPLAVDEPRAAQPGQATLGRAVRKAATKATARRPSRRARASQTRDLFDCLSVDADDRTPGAATEVAADRTELRHEPGDTRDDGFLLVHLHDGRGDDGDGDDDDHVDDGDGDDDDGDHADNEDPVTSPAALIVFGSGAWLPSSDPPPPATSAAALTMLEARGDLSARQLERLRSDVRVAARLSGRTPETLPTDPLAPSARCWSRSSLAPPRSAPRAGRACGPRFVG